MAMARTMEFHCSHLSRSVKICQGHPGTMASTHLHHMPGHPYHHPCTMCIYVYLCIFMPLSSLEPCENHWYYAAATRCMMLFVMLLKHILLAMPLSVSSSLIISHPNGVWERPKHTRVDSVDTWEEPRNGADSKRRRCGCGSC